MGAACLMARLGRLVTSLPMSLITLYQSKIACEGLVSLAFSQSGQSSRNPVMSTSTERKGQIRTQLCALGPTRGLEPLTVRLQVGCATNCATSAWQFPALLILISQGQGEE